MTLFDLILIAISLSMDAFAVSICKGLSVHKGQLCPRHDLRAVVRRLPVLDAHTGLLPG